VHCLLAYFEGEFFDHPNRKHSWHRNEEPEAKTGLKIAPRPKVHWNTLERLKKTQGENKIFG
jgi:hypothetical protein